MSHRFLNACHTHLHMHIHTHFPSHSSSFLAGFSGPIGQSDTWRSKNSSVERSRSVTPEVPLLLFSVSFKTPSALFQNQRFSPLQWVNCFMLLFHKKSHYTEKETEADTPLPDAPSTMLKPDRRVLLHLAPRCSFLVRRCWLIVWNSDSDSSAGFNMESQVCNNAFPSSEVSPLQQWLIHSRQPPSGMNNLHHLSLIISKQTKKYKALVFKPFQHIHLKWWTFCKMTIFS